MFLPYSQRPYLSNRRRSESGYGLKATDFIDFSKFTDEEFNIPLDTYYRYDFFFVPKAIQLILSNISFVLKADRDCELILVIELPSDKYVIEKSVSLKKDEETLVKIEFEDYWVSGSDERFLFAEDDGPAAPIFIKLKNISESLGVIWALDNLSIDAKFKPRL